MHKTIMKTVIIYDSLHGNTKMIAEAVAEGINRSAVRVVSIVDAKMSDIDGVNILIVGAPTHGGRPKPSMQEFLDAIPEGRLQGVGVAAFDTRFLEQEQRLPLRLLMKVIGYAAPKIARDLIAKGGKLVALTEGFIVTGTEGGIRDGELERAKAWGELIGRVRTI